MLNGILQIPKIPIVLLNAQGEKTPFVESLPPCFSTEHHLFPYVFSTYPKIRNYHPIHD